MKRSSRVKRFPKERLKKVQASDLRLVEQSGHQEWLAAMESVTSRMARRFGLGTARVSVERVQVLKVEDLRETLPGHWVFAVLVDPLGERKGFLALDPRMGGRVLSRLKTDSSWGRGCAHIADGTAGALGFVIAAALEELSTEEGEAFAGWRFMGLLESSGELGRANLSEPALLGTWLRVSAGLDQGWAAWLEPESSVMRRRPVRLEDDSIDGLEGTSLPVRWQAGYARLSYDELVQLECGDVVLLQGGPEGQLCLRAGPLTVLGTVQGDRLTVTDIQMQDGGEIMTATQLHNQGEGPGLSAGELGRLPVELVAEAGRMFLTVGQLHKLRVGHVLVLPADVLGPLELRAGGRLVARGELVEVEGQRGIRLTEMAAGVEACDEDAA